MNTKWIIGLIVGLLGIGGTFGLSGCGLLGPSVEKAAEVAENRQAEVQRALEAFQAAEEALKDVVNKYEAAVSKGDTTAAEQLALIMREAIARYSAAKEVVDSSKTLFEAAVEDFKKAKSTADYIGTIFGWIKALFGVGAGAGGIGALFSKKLSTAKDALEATTDSIEKLKEGKVWTAVKADMLGRLDVKALKMIDAARP